MEPERFFSFRWHPYALEEGVDYSVEPTTLVTFTLEEAGAGTRLTIVESGFDAIPESRRAKAFSMNATRLDRSGREHPEVPVGVGRDSARHLVPPPFQVSVLRLRTRLDIRSVVAVCGDLERG